MLTSSYVIGIAPDCLGSGNLLYNSLDLSLEDCILGDLYMQWEAVNWRQSWQVSGQSVLSLWPILISGLCAAIAGLLLTIRLESAGPNAGDGVEMNAIAAVVVGGTSLSGGRGTVMGTVLGVILISLVSNAVNLIGEFPPAWG